MDGVLVDVTESYRETIARTVAFHLARRHAANSRLQNQGGLTTIGSFRHHGLERRARAWMRRSSRVREHFQKDFLGNGADGLILRERWVARPGALGEG